MKKIDYSKRGPLIKVQIGPGRFVKMYERDAIARGLVKKERPQVENKMMVPEEEKSPQTDPLPKEKEIAPHSPLTPVPLPEEREKYEGEREGPKRKKKHGAVRDREVGGSIPVTRVDEEKIPPQTETPHPDLLPREKETLEGDMEG